MRLPSKPYSSLPIYSIGSTNTLPRDRVGPMAAVGQGLFVAPEPGQSAAAASPASTGAAKGASKAAGKARGAAKPDKSSEGSQRHSIHKTMARWETPHFGTTHWSQVLLVLQQNRQWTTTTTGLCLDLFGALWPDDESRLLLNHWHLVEKYLHQGSFSMVKSSTTVCSDALNYSKYSVAARTRFLLHFGAKCHLCWLLKNSPKFACSTQWKWLLEILNEF